MINLFDEFDPVSKEKWLEKATADMKGENPLEKFKKELTNNIFQLPYYDHSDLKDIEYTNISLLLPDRQFDPWFNTEMIRISNEKDANTLAIKALNSGANGLHFITEQSDTDLEILLKNIELPYCYLSFQNFDKSVVLEYLAKKDPSSESGGYNISIIKNDQSVEFNSSDSSASASGILRDITLSVGKEPEASLVRNMASQLSRFVDIVCKTNDENVQNLYDRLIIQNTCQQHYFLEVAKLRALRILFAEAGAYFGLSAPRIFIQSITSTGEDELQNLLINTTQAMAAVTGGTDALIITPHIDKPADQDQRHFTQRIARNVSNLLEEESHLGKVKDPAAGSYYICSLTDQLVTKTWGKFKELEELGGFSKLNERIA